MSDKRLLLWLPVKQELIMKSFQGINCFYKEQERLMWVFAGSVTSARAPRCDTSILKVAKLIFLQVTNLLNGHCFLREVGHSKWIWLVAARGTFILWVHYSKTSHLVPVPATATSSCWTRLGSRSQAGLCCWLPESPSNSHRPMKTAVTGQLSESYILLLSLICRFALAS